MKFIVVYFLLLVSVSFGRSGLLEMSQSLWSKLLNGGLSNIGPLDPLRVPIVKVDQSHGRVNYRMILTNIEISGLNDSSLESIHVGRGSVKSNLTEQEAGYVSYNDRSAIDSIRYRFHTLVKGPNNNKSQHEDLKVVPIEFYQNRNANIRDGQGEVDTRDSNRYQESRRRYSNDDNRRYASAHQDQQHYQKIQEQPQYHQQHQYRPPVKQPQYPPQNKYLPQNHQPQYPPQDEYQPNHHQPEEHRPQHPQPGESQQHHQQEHQPQHPQPGESRPHHDDQEYRPQHPQPGEPQPHHQPQHPQPGEYPPHHQPQEHRPQHPQPGESQSHHQQDHRPQHPQSAESRPHHDNQEYRPHHDQQEYRPQHDQQGEYQPHYQPQEHQPQHLQPGESRPHRDQEYRPQHPQKGEYQPHDQQDYRPHSQQGGYPPHEQQHQPQHHQQDEHQPQQKQPQYPQQYEYQQHQPQYEHQQHNQHRGVQGDASSNRESFATSENDQRPYKQIRPNENNYGKHHQIPQIESFKSTSDYSTPKNSEEKSNSGNYDDRNRYLIYARTQQNSGYTGDRKNYQNGAKLRENYERIETRGNVEYPKDIEVHQMNGKVEIKYPARLTSSDNKPCDDVEIISQRPLEENGKYQKSSERLKDQPGFVDIIYADDKSKKMRHFGNLHIEPRGDKTVYSLEDIMRDLENHRRFIIHNFTESESLLKRNDKLRTAEEAQRIKDMVRYAKEFQEKQGYFEEGMELIYHYGNGNETKVYDGKRTKRAHEQENENENEDDIMHVIIKIRVPLLKVKANYVLMGKVGNQVLHGNGQLSGNFTELIGDFTVELKKSADNKTMTVRAARAKLEAGSKSIKLEGMDENGVVTEILTQGLMASEAVAAMLADDLATKALSESAADAMIYRMYKELPAN